MQRCEYLCTSLPKDILRTQNIPYISDKYTNICMEIEWKWERASERQRLKNIFWEVKQFKSKCGTDRFDITFI
jgi:hypothetical protein